MKKYSETYKTVFTERALKDLETFDKATKNRIGKKIRDYSKQPLKYSKKLVSFKIGGYRFRIGNYRVIFDIVKDEIVILRIGHRKNIYQS